MRFALLLNKLNVFFATTCYENVNCVNSLEQIKTDTFTNEKNVYKYFASDVVSELISTKDNRYSNFSILEKTKTKGIKKNTHIFFRNCVTSTV